MFKDIKISLDKIAFIILGALFCFFISFFNSIFFESSLNIYLKLIFCGFVAILAALLPGISGSLILVIFGIYPIIINALSNISNFQNIKIILFLSFGIFLGLSIFPRFILFFLKKYYNQTLSFLIGLMIGSIYTLWPFFTYRKTYLDSKLILVNEKFQFPNIFSLEFIKCFAFILFGSFVFYKIKQLSTKKDKKINEDTCI
ncbi:MAG: hypothetical protein KR126chlam6_01517 [Candidatus Anoxychlamydiales bacterium]|nr:hypothetical protein [Candidatus Anoxychlamydiales bacterium]